MYELQRISKDPATPLRIQVDQPEVGSEDAGFLGGGSFYFSPAGQDGDRHQVSEHAAKVIMGDSGLARHFECIPPLKPATAAADTGAAKAAKPSKQADATEKTR